METTRICTYDIETYKNLFLIVFFDLNEQKHYVFEISKRKNDIYELFMFLKSCSLLIGFNNVRFDSPLINKFAKLSVSNYTPKKIVETLYHYAQDIIKNGIGYNFNHIIPQMDLFLINHFDNFAKSTSLKVLEFNMEMTNIQELPFPFNRVLADEEIPAVIDYCINDVNATTKFYYHNLKGIGFRKKMSKVYLSNFTNVNDVKIGEIILLKAVAKEMNMDEFDVKKMRTIRKMMNMSEIILDYISFESLEFNTLLNWWKDKIIFQTKGQFSEIPLDTVQPLLPYCNNELKKKKLKKLNIIFDNFQFDFGTGGLHGAYGPGVWYEDEDEEVILVDVSSYYPNLAYANKFHPAHIPIDVFMRVIHILYQQRMKGRDEGDEDMVKGIKLALNGALYGKSNSEYSFMFDPQFMMLICVNGQLLLSMLAEQLVLKAKAKLIQVNTDGVMIKVARKNRHLVDQVTQEWMRLTSLKLDYDHFRMIVQRDVNNYFGIYTNGKKKYKGAFDYNYAKNGEWHKNFSMLIVAKALEAYYLTGIDPETYIKSHGNIYDFFLKTKFDKNTQLIAREYDGERIVSQEVLQNITRYYVSKEGKTFIKVMPPLKGKQDDRESFVESGYLTSEVNNMADRNISAMFNNIDYDFYINKVKDITEKIDNSTELKKHNIILI